MRGARGLVLVALSSMVVASTALPSLAEASTLVVDEDGMASALHCNDRDVAYFTIEAALADAADGDVIKVCPGRFRQTVVVEKSVALEGAKAGLDARARDGVGETIMNAPGGAFDVRASGVEIDGFTIQAATDAAGLGSGATFSASHSGYRFVNNIVRDNISGIYLNSDGAAQTIVQRNLFKANDEPGPRSGNAIYSDSGLSNVLIDRNRFIEHPVGGNAMAFFGGISVPGTSQSRLTISNNALVNDNAIALFNTTASSITRNRIRSKESGVFIGGGVNGLTITRNNFAGSFRGIRVPAVSADQRSSNITVQRNRFDSHPDWAILVLDGGYEGILDARRNWWGHSSGPRGWATGFGQLVWANASFFPWSLNSSHTSFARCTKVGTLGDDVIDGTAGNDVLCGRAGEDIIRGRGGNDLILGGGGGDSALIGGNGNDALIGETGDDVLRGGAGFDSLQGWDGLDSCLVDADSGRVATCES